MDLVKKSQKVLKKLQLKNGGITATPIGQAYPYVYPRDAVFVTKAYNLLGLCKNSEKFYYFIKNSTRTEYFKEIFHRYDENGNPCVTRKHEHDNNGLIIHGIHDAFKHGKNKSFIIDMWPLIKICVKAILKNKKENLIRTERSIHEFFRLENGFEIWTNCVSCRALYDAAEIAKELNCKEHKTWFKEAESLKKNIKKRFLNKNGLFRKNLKFKDSPDMSQLSPFYFNIIDSKKLLKKNLDYLKNSIWCSEVGGFRRFKKFDKVKDWHWYTGGSGAWIIFTLWGARFYKILKDRKNMNQCLKLVDKTAKALNGLLPEHVSTKYEYDLWEKNEIELNHRIQNGVKIAKKTNQIFKKKTGEDLIAWASPLGWSHAEYILFKNEV